MLLIYPPLAKACEPPAGIARLAGVLRGHGRQCTLLDANLEGQFHLLAQNTPASDTWSRRARRNLPANLAALRSPGLYLDPARYQRAVSDLNRVLQTTSRPGLNLNLANYQDESLSPLKSGDLLRAAARPATNIFHDYFGPRLEEMLAESAYDLIGFSINYLSQALPGFAMIGYLKKHHPNLPIVAGGGLITSWLRNPNWRNPFIGLIDHLIAGPGESALLGLLSPEADDPLDSRQENAVRRQTSANPTNSEKITRQTPAGKSRDFGPDYQGLPLADYLAPGLILPYAASAGCYWRKCSFCPETAENNPYHHLTPEVVLAQIKILKAKTAPTLLHFLDNAISPALMRALIADPPGLRWYSFARVGPELTDPEFCRALRGSGCVMLKLGLESGDQEVLDAMHKGIDLGMVAKALANLEKAGIATYVYLLFGTPTESLAAARRTLAFTVAHRSAITFLNLAIFNMPLGSPDVADLAANVFYDGDLSLYTDFEHPLGWHRKEIRRFLDREFKRHPAIAPILRRDPPFFTSNHAAFFRHLLDL
jgi:radical SAM superfamily enzyme YgiQ (UPF0313 family)